MKTTQYSGYECVELANDALTVLVTKSIGPRIISLSLTGKENLLAQIPDAVAECTNVGPYHFYGGHDLFW